MNEIATFALGCFWQPDLLFSKLNGVIKVQVGYTGGNLKEYPNPTYEQVCTGKTKYAESVDIEFDPKIISYNELLDIFWKSHNPTSLNRQGPDIGEQYRSEIFYHSLSQKEKAEASKKKFQKNLSKPIVTQITRASKFFPAEEYHQKYLEKRGLGSCHI